MKSERRMPAGPRRRRLVLHPAMKPTSVLEAIALGSRRRRIVGEVLIGLLDLDSSSVRHAPGDGDPRHSDPATDAAPQPSA